MTIWSNRKIATGWDNEAGFTVVESIAVTGTSHQLEDILPALPLDANTHYFVRVESPTVNRVSTTAGSVQSGYEVVTWTIPICSDNALKYWIDTYVGKVTIATQRLIYDTYENWNAIASYPQYNEEARDFCFDHWWYFNVRVDMKLVSTT